jgi:serine phosphatase RsbU (regulator of sigma subunit)
VIPSFPSASAAAQTEVVDTDGNDFVPAGPGARPRLRAVLTTDLLGVVTGWDRGARWPTRHAAREAVGKPLAELLGVAGLDAPRLRAAAASGTPVELEVPDHDTGREVPVDAQVSLLADGADDPGGFAVLLTPGEPRDDREPREDREPRDDREAPGGPRPDGRHTAQERLALLGEAGTRIGTTLNVGRTAEEFCAFAVPRLADFVSVDLLDPVFRGAEPPAGTVDASVVLRRVAHRSTLADTPEAAVGIGAADHYPAFSPPVRCLVTGRPVIAGFDEAEMTEWLARHPTRLKRARDYDFRSIMAIPLRARATTLGVAVFLRQAGSEPFDGEDAVLAAEIAGRAAVCLDNARRYTREHTTALTLQKSLLPRDNPGPAAVDVAYRYRAAGEVAEVGGDWFDVIPLSGARVAFVVGDTVGHGIHAAAAMGRLRTAVRTLADVDLPPDELLAHLDDLVAGLTPAGERGAAADGDGDREGAETGATCLYAVYDPVSCVCTLASAGHPPPVVLRGDGTVETVETAPGPPLGVGGYPFETTEIDLPEGSLLALYTDGLIATREHDTRAGVEALAQALTGAVPSLEATCDAVLASPGLGWSSDDVALVIARTRALSGSQVAAWALPADPEVVAQARAEAARQLSHWGLEDLSFVTELTVSELVTNAIRYGQPPISLRLIRDRTLICEVSDGSGAAPHLRRARSFDEGGRGLHMVAQFCSKWGTRHTATGKTIWAEQPLEPVDA